MLIIGVDPGTVSGLFWINMANTWDENVGWGEFRSRSLGLNLSLVLNQWLAVNSPNTVLVGCEKYIITSNSAKTNQPDALKVTGIVEYLCDLAGGVTVHSIIKANALKVASNDRLRRVGWWPKSMGHAQDAARIALAVTAARHPGVFSALPGVLQ